MSLESRLARPGAGLVRGAARASLSERGEPGAAANPRTLYDEQSATHMRHRSVNDVAVGHPTMSRKLFEVVRSPCCFVLRP